jgi:hypothetical protein
MCIANDCNGRGDSRTAAKRRTWLDVEAVESSGGDGILIEIGSVAEVIERFVALHRVILK